MKSDKPTHTAYPKLPDGPLGQHWLWQHLQDEVPVVEGVLVRWPVMVTLYLEENRQKKSESGNVTPPWTWTFPPGKAFLSGNPGSAAKAIWHLLCINLLMASAEAQLLLLVKGRRSRREERTPISGSFTFRAQRSWLRFLSNFLSISVPLAGRNILQRSFWREI